MPRKKKPPSAEKLVEHCWDNHQATGTLGWPWPRRYDPDTACCSVRVCDEPQCRAFANAYVVEVTGNEGVFLSFTDARKAAAS